MYECIYCIKKNKCKKSGIRPPNLKNRQFQEEKILARKRARSHLNMEKSSKNLDKMCLSPFGVAGKQKPRPV
jgi:hypothetical protein